MQEYKGDTHIHSEFSLRSKLRIEDAIKEAEKKDLDFIALTDNVEFSVQPVKEVLHRISNRNKKIDELQKNTKVKIIKAIEISEPQLYPEEVKSLEQLGDIDYIVGNIRHIYGIHLKKMIRNTNAYQLYLNSMKCMVENANIDSVAHLDLIKKYIQDQEFDQELLEEILKTMIKNNIALEINTSGIQDKNGLYPSLNIIKLYKSLGGKYVTIGSGAVKSNEIYSNIKSTNEELNELDLTPVYILGRKAKQIK